MRTLNSFLQFVPNRAASALTHLRSRVWLRRVPLAVEATRATPEHRALGAAKNDKRMSVAPGSVWGRLYDQRWCRVTIPAGAGTGANARYLEWRDQGEATVYVDGVPYYGFDVAHRYVALPERTREVWVESICCQSAIWHPDATGLSARGSVFDGAWLVQRDDQAWAALHDLQCLFDLMMHLRAQQEPVHPPGLPRVGLQPSVGQVTPVFRRVLRLLDEALDAFDLEGVAALRRRLARAFEELRTDRPVARAILTGHAHIDLVWLWPERVGEAKAVHTFATVNRLMSLYPELRFAYSQPASYAAVERRTPELMRRVRQRVRSGLWEPTGAMYVESDTLLPCGEALARSLELGQAEFRKLRGSPSRLLWLPDVFGYSACLPQLMKLTGVDWFFTTKLTWSGINRFPYSSFLWRGNDGSDVVAHVTQDSGYNNLVDLPRLHANANGHAQSDVHAEFLHPTGFGDGGGGPTEEMCERARRLGALADTPAISWDQPEAFFARLERLRSHLPVWQGECYLEFHRGTYTTHGNLKAAFRALERALQLREAAAVATGVVPDLTHAWQRLVFAQFHDYIPGSSVAEVYAEGVPELARLAAGQQAAATRALTAGKGAWHVFNPLPHSWRGWVKNPETQLPVWMDIAPLSSVAIERAATNRSSPATAGKRTLTTDRLRAEVDAHGCLRRLCIDGRDLALAAPAARAVLYPDRPANYESWDIDRHSLDLGEPVRTAVLLEIEKGGGERAVIAVRRKLGRASTMVLRYVAVAGEPMLRIEVELDWREEHTLLKLHFPTAYRGLHARFGAPFGSVLRGQQPGSPTVEAQWEVPGSRWAAVALDGEREGLAVVTEAKYGFSACNGELTVSLVRSPRVTGRDDHRYAAPPGLSRLQLDSPFTDQGRHTIRLAIGSYDIGGAAEKHPAVLSDTLFTPPLVHRGPPRTCGLLGIDDAPTLVPCWAKPLDGRSWLLRLHEVGGQRGRARLNLAPGWNARRCAFDGSVKRATRPQAQLDFVPYQILSVRVSRERMG